MNVSGQVCLRRGEESRVRGGTPWIFENELDWADDTCEKGGLVDVLDSRLRFCARGFWNPGSKICVRVLTRDQNETIDRAFFRRRLLAAWENRLRLGFSDACRVVFGEADGLLKYTDREVLVREKRREDRLREAGFEVFRFTWAEALHRPDLLAENARRAFARALRLSRRPA